MNNEKIYEITKGILEAPIKEKDSSILTARELLYGKNGFNIDYDLYYESLTSSFAVKIQSLIKKIGNDLYFDLSQNVRDLWNICFLGEFINVEMMKQYDKEISTTTDINRIDEINNILNIIQNRLNDVYLLKPDSVSINESDMEKIKKSILLIQKIKDSLMHNGDQNRSNINTSKETLDIYNVGGRFPLESSIPFQYIVDFINNDIKAKDEDKKLSDTVDSIVFPIIEQMNYKSEDNIFYNTENFQTINHIIDIFDNDMVMVYQLPTSAFKNKPEDIDHLVDILGNKYDLLELEEYAYMYLDNTIELIKKYGFDNVKEFPNEMFKYKFEDINEYIDTYGFDNAIMLLNNPYKIDKISDFIQKHGVEDAKKLVEFRDINDIGYVEHGLKYFDMETLTKLNLVSIFNYDSVKKLIDKFGIDVVSKLPSCCYNNYQLVIELDNKYSLENIIQDFFQKPTRIKYSSFSDDIMMKRSKTKEIEFNPFISSASLEGLDKFIDKYGYQQAKNVKNGEIFSIYQYSSSMIDKIIEKYGLEILDYAYYNISEESLNYSIDEVKRVPYLINVPYDIGKKCIEKYGLEKLAKLDEKAAYGRYLKIMYENEITDVESIPEYFEEDIMNAFISRYGKENIKYIPRYLFSSHFFPERRFEINCLINYLFEYTGDNETLKKKIPVLFHNLFSDVNTVDMIRDSLPMHEIYNAERSLDDDGFILKSEYTQKYKEKLDSLTDEILTRYNELVSKSVFGIDNPKIIALYCYMSYVMPKYDYNVIGRSPDLLKALAYIEPVSSDKNRIISTLEDYTSKTRLDNGTVFPAVNKYFNGINAFINYGKSELLDDKKSEYIAEIESVIGRYTNENTNRVLRNAVSHFRFKEVTDDSGNVIDNKVLIYDINEDGVLTYTNVFDIDELFDYVRKLELFMEGNEVENNFDKMLSKIGSDSEMPLTFAMYDLLNTKVEKSSHKVK